MKHFLRKKLFSLALLFVSVAVLGGVVVVYAQNNLTIDKDIILGTGRSIKFPDNTTLNSATGLGGGAWTTTSTKIYPQSASYVGIGTSNPTSPLYVVGTTTIAGILQVGAGGGLGEAATSTVIYRSSFVDSDNLSYYLDPANSAISAVLAGNVGIGVTSPAAKLVVAGNGTGIAKIGDVFGSGNYVGASFNGSSSSNDYNILSSLSDQALYINRPSGKPILFREANSDQVAIISGGNVGIGTASPVQKLDVRGNIYLPGGNYITWNNGDSQIGGVSGYALAFSTYTGSAMTEKMRITSAGNVGIGVAAPTYKLQVAGVIYADEGTSAADIIGNKIDGTTFDPVYTIEGKRYATYNPGMVGVKEEIGGIVTLSAKNGGYEAELDLNSQEKGGDLWLFTHTIDVAKNGIKNVVVLLTPSFDGKVWYEKDLANNKIVIHGASNSAGDYEVSYRLTAPRFDSKDWTNYSSSDWEGLNLDTYYKK